MKSLVTIGTFDGLHRGHQALLRRLLRTSRRLRLRPMVILFHRPPRFLLRPETAMPLLTTETERAEGIRRLGIRRVLVLRFNSKIARMPHPSFFERYVLNRCEAGGLVVGPDFAFGRKRLGNTEWLRNECRRRGLHFEIVPLLRQGRIKASSSRIRALLLKGDVAHAGILLGRPYRVSGRVVRGRGVGRLLGFPTANLKIPEGKFVPRGVYRVRVKGARPGGKPASGVCNVGTRPTFGGGSRTHVEAHLLDFSGSLLGKTLSLDFLRRLRGERRFSSAAALTAQIRRDVRRARAT